MNKPLISAFVSMGYFNKFLSVKVEQCHNKKHILRGKIHDFCDKYPHLLFDIVKVKKDYYYPVLANQDNTELNIHFSTVNAVKALKYVLLEELENAI
jgi:hypothetical protein